MIFLNIFVIIIMKGDIKMEEIVKQSKEKSEIYNFNVDKCVICGKIIPEGSQVCTECRNEWR